MIMITTIIMDTYSLNCLISKKLKLLEMNIDNFKRINFVHELSVNINQQLYLFKFSNTDSFKAPFRNCLQQGILSHLKVRNQVLIKIKVGKSQRHVRCRGTKKRKAQRHESLLGKRTLNLANSPPKGLSMDLDFAFLDEKNKKTIKF